MEIGTTLSRGCRWSPGELVLEFLERVAAGPAHLRAILPPRIDKCSSRRQSRSDPRPGCFARLVPESDPDGSEPLSRSCFPTFPFALATSVPPWRARP